MSTPPPSTVTDSSPLGSLADGDGGVGGEAMRSRIAEKLFGQEAAPVRIGRFELAEQLGVGGMGVVHRAYDPKLGRDVAVKVLHGDRVSARERERMLREAQALAKLNHPNVVQVYEVGEHDDQVFIAMEYVAGRSAKQWQEGGKRPWREVLDVYLQAGEGLAAAHAAGIVHRDFKPANVLIGDDGRVRVADFGLARGRDAGSSETGWSGEGGTSEGSGSGSDREALTKTGAVLGTPAYMAPEQLAGEPADERSDQFSFCVSLWEGLTGERPYSVVELKCGTRSSPLPPTRSAPGWVFRAVTRGLRIARGERAVSLRQVLTALSPPGRRRARWLGLPLALITAGGFGFLLAEQGRAASRCRQLSQRVALEWSPARKAAVVRRLGDVAPYAEPVAESVSSSIDRYYADWRRVAGNSCRDNDGLDSDRVYACLEQAASRGREALDLLDNMTTDDAASAHSIMADLDSPSRCNPAHGSIDDLPPIPMSLETRLDVANLRARLHRARLHVRTGKNYDELPDSGRELLEAAEAVGFLPASAEAHVVAGEIESATGSPNEAIRLYDRAVELAQRAAYDEFVVVGLTGAARVAANRLEDVNLARRYLGLASATAERVPLPLVRRRELDESKLSVLLASGELEPALATARKLAEQSERDGGSSDSRARASRVLADLYVRTGRRKDAESLYRELLEQQVASMGPGHPAVASTELSFGLLLGDEPSDSLPHLERALAIAEAAFGPRSPRLARYSTAAALAHLRSGDLATARKLASRAWELRRPLPDQQERGSALAVLVELDLAEGNDERLIEHLQTLVRAWDTPGHVSQFAQATNRLAWHLCRLDRCPEALPHYTRLREVTQPADRLRRFAELGLAHVELASGRYDSALALMEPLLREHEAGELDLDADYLTELRLFESAARLRRDHNDSEARELLEELRPSLVDQGQLWAVSMIDQLVQEQIE